MFETMTRMGSSAAGSYEIEKSLRFNDPDNSVLTRTAGTSTSQYKFTFSTWVKLARGAEATTDYGELINGYTASNDAGFGAIYFYAGSLRFAGWSTNYRVTNRMFRDPSSWYHIVVAVDTTLGTADNRVKMYINGVEETSFSASNNPGQNDTFGISNNSAAMRIGMDNSASSSRTLDGYMAETYFIDGQQLNASNFGETDASTGQWIPKEYKGTYGTNGFYLDFADKSNTTATTLGKDSSGNSNNFTPTNFNTYDVFPDTPTNNFPIMNVAQKYYLITPKQGGLYTGVALGADPWIRTSTFAVKGGKWFMEMRIADEGSYSAPSGVSSGGISFGGPTLLDPDSTWLTKEIAVPYNGTFYSNGGIVQSGLTSALQGDVFSFAVDCDSFTCDVWRNGSSYGSQIDWSGHSDVNEFFVGMQGASGGSYWNSGQFFNYGQDSSFSGSETAGNNSDANGYGDFSMAVPAGYLALCSQNLPAPTIKDGTKYFNTVLYEGTGSLLTSPSVGFQPDLTWVKNRDDTDDQVLQDSERGNKVFTGINDNDVEGDTGGGWITEIADGFTVDANGQANTNGESFVGWCWKEGASNGFDMVTFTPSSGANTYSHGLGVKPNFILFKCRTEAAAWDVYHSSLTADYKLYFNDSVAKIDSGFMNDTEPTSSVFTFDPGSQNGDVHIAYCFSNVTGFSFAGSYIGNGNSDGPYVFTGFKVSYLLVKNADRGANWTVYDVKRETNNPIDQILEPNINNAEETGHDFDLLSNGFKVRNSNSSFNHSGEKMVFIAFAETAFKYANAR